MTSFAGLMLQSSVILLFDLALLVLVVVLALGDKEGFRANRWTGLVLGFIWFLLCLPLVIFTITHVDMAALVQRANVPPDRERFVVIFVYAGLLIGFTISIIKIAWYMLVYHVAAGQWGQMRPGALPLMQRRGPVPWGAIAGGAAFGVAAGAVSTVVFRLLHVDVSDALKQFATNTPALTEASPWVSLPLVTLAVTGAALVEELVFRGVLLGWLLRLARNRTAGIVLATVLVSLLWAGAHFPNTNEPLAKCTQIFVIGLFFCEFARRSCIEAAIAAHVGLNVAALLIGAAMS